MFRNILIAAALSLSLLSPLVITGSVQAYEAHYNHHDHNFRVFVRDCAREPWRFVGSFHHRDDAWRLARSYRVQGFETSVR